MTPLFLLKILKPLRAVLIGVLSFFALLSVAWLLTAHDTKTQLDAWIKREAALGHTITYSDEDISGFPFHVELFLGHLLWDQLDGAGFSTPSLLLRTTPWPSGFFKISMPQGANLSLRLPSLAVPFGLKAYEEIQGAASIDAMGQIKAFSLQSDHLAAGVEHQTVFNTDHWQIVLKDPPTPPRTDRDTGLIAEVTTDNLVLTNPKVPLGPRLRSLSAALRVTGIPPRLGDRLSVAAWNQSGGVVELDRLALDWVPLDVTLSGTVALSSAMQPQAALTATVKGLAHTLESLEQEKWISAEGKAKIEQAALTAAMKPADKSKWEGSLSDEPVLLPLTLQDGRLMLQDAPLISLPPLQWPR